MKGDVCPDCQAPMSEHVQDYCPHEIETGERYARSGLTDTLYKVTKWVELADDKMVALHKEEVEPQVQEN